MMSSLSEKTARLTCAPCKGGAFQWVQAQRPCSPAEPTRGRVPQLAVRRPNDFRLAWPTVIEGLADELERSPAGRRTQSHPK
jgi:hypothetical protein